MKAKDFIGLIPPIPTAFNPDGTIYEKGLRNIVRFIMPHVHGFFPIGTYGSGPLMNLTDRKRALEIIIDEVNGEIPLIAHVGSADTNSAIELAKHAKASGAQAVAAISPYYSPNLPQDYLFRYFADIVDAVGDSNFPVFLYNNARHSGNNISPELLRRLAAYGLGGCKESSFDLIHYHFFQEAVKDFPDFNLIIGTEAIFVPAFQMGATACVCGIANVYPELVRKMYDEYMAGDIKAALKTQKHVLNVREVTKLGNSFAIVHYILKLRGVDAGMCKRPLLPIPEDLEKKIKQSLIDLEEL